MDLDLENGSGTVSGGGGNNDASAVLTAPNSADPEDRMERQPPLTWLRAAPFIAAILAGVAQKEELQQPLTLERQLPLTWLRAAPLIAAILAGVALLAVYHVLGVRSCKVVVVGSAGQDKLQCRWYVWLCLYFGAVLFAIPGVFLAVLAIIECERREAAASPA